MTSIAPHLNPKLYCNIFNAFGPQALINPTLMARKSDSVKWVIHIIDKVVKRALSSKHGTHTTEGVSACVPSCEKRN